MSNPLAPDLDHVLEHTREVWKELSGARIFITGGTGFFGCWLLESFAWAVDRLGLRASAVVLTRSPERFPGKAPHLARHPAIQLAQGDVRCFEFPAGRFTHAIHGAAEANPRLNREQPLLMLETIVDGTRRTLDFAAAAGVRRFLLLSSGAVYGAQPADLARVTEDYRGAPDTADAQSAYAEGKRVAEMLGAVYAGARGLEVPVARCFAFAGPHLPLDAHFAIGNFINDCLHARPIAVRGDGTAYRSYLYTADLAIWLWTILARGQSGRAYNVGSEQAVSIAELAEKVRETLGAAYEVRIAQARRAAAAERYVPDTSRARTELGLEEWIPLEEAIRRTARHAAPAFYGEVCA
jgi:dTDP-glucose 4,6-dehydratase